MSKMDFSRGFNIHLATLFGIGKIPGGGTWASLIVLLIALYENNAGTASFLAFLSLIIGPKAYKKLVSVVDSEDPKEFVLDEVIGMGIAISGVYIFSRLINEFSFNIFSDYTSLSDIGNLFILTFIFLYGFLNEAIPTAKRSRQRSNPDSELYPDNEAIPGSF